jgi:hypothetical protein
MGPWVEGIDRLAVLIYHPYIYRVSAGPILDPVGSARVSSTVSFKIVFVEFAHHIT